MLLWVAAACAAPAVAQHMEEEPLLFNPAAAQMETDAAARQHMGEQEEEALPFNPWRPWGKSAATLPGRSHHHTLHAAGSEEGRDAVTQQANGGVGAAHDGMGAPTGAANGPAAAAPAAADGPHGPLAVCALVRNEQGNVREWIR